VQGPGRIWICVRPRSIRKRLAPRTSPLASLPRPLPRPPCYVHGKRTRYPRVAGSAGEESIRVRYIVSRKENDMSETNIIIRDSSSTCDGVCGSQQENDNGKPRESRTAVERNVPSRDPADDQDLLHRLGAYFDRSCLPHHPEISLGRYYPQIAS
jgi:hypothetical protein